MGRGGSKKHTHKYRKLRSQIWACALPDCTHHLPPNVAELIEGKYSICWICDQPLIMGDKEIRMDKPICPKCILKAQGIGIIEYEAMIEFEETQKREKKLKESVQSDSMDRSNKPLFGDE